MHNHLMNGGCYRRLNKDPNAKIIGEVLKAIQNSSLDDKVKKNIILEILSSFVFMDYLKIIKLGFP